MCVQIMQQVFPNPPAPLHASSEAYDILLNGVAGYPDPSPIFVVGMPRSGSTLVEHILSSHPSAHGAGAHSSLFHPQRTCVSDSIVRITHHHTGTMCGASHTHTLRQWQLHPACLPSTLVRHQRHYACKKSKTLGTLVEDAETQSMVA